MAEKAHTQKGLIARLGDTPDAPPWGWGEVGLALGITLVGTLIIGSGVTVATTQDSANPSTLSLIMGWMVGLAIVTGFVLIRWRSDRERFAALWSDTQTWNPLLAMLVGVAGAFTTAVIVGIGSTDFLIPLHVNGVDGSNIGVLLLLCAFTMLVLPFAEGLVFFGVLQPRVRSVLGGWAGLLTVVVVYGLYYFLVYGAGRAGGTAIWYGAVYPMMLAFTIGAVRAWSGSTVSAILAHVGIGLSVMVSFTVL